MSSSDGLLPRRRRRGDDLEAAILDAAWAELVEIGYARLTMGSVAARAETSEPVLYRRWPDKDHLVVAAMSHFRDRHPVVPPDTGSLRGDLLAELETVGRARAGFFAIASAAAFAGLLGGTGPTPAQVRDRVMGEHFRAQDRAIYRRADARGDIDLAALPETVLDLPFDLVRHDLLMDSAPPSAERIRSIVDDVALPLLQPPSSGQRPEA